jgi:hypothetical protein
MNEVTIGKYGITFTVGEESWNHKGAYIVTAISDDGATMDVSYQGRYEHQTIKTLDQAKVIHNAKRRELDELRMSELDLDGDNESFTLGYIAHSGWLSIRLKESDMPWFKSAYAKLTGSNVPTANKRGENLTVIPDDANRGQNYYIIFPEPNDAIKALLSFGCEIKWHDWKAGAKVHSKNVLLNLMGKGFHLGKNQTRIGAIRERVVNKDQFDKGVAAASTMLAA